MRLVAALLLVAVCGPGCARQDSPEAVARVFLSKVSRDPIGTLPLLTEAFHGRHGLRHSVPGVSDALGSRRAAPLPSDPIARRRELSAARLGWLILQGQEAVRAEAGFIELTRVEDEQEDDRAAVAFRIRFGDARDLVQRFVLVRREDGARWQIDAIEQQGVGPSNVAHAFALAPSAELLRRASEWQQQGTLR